MSELRELYQSVILDHNKSPRNRGELAGAFADAPRGSEGFGYDPIFDPAGETRTVAELGDAWKDDHSHRALAARELARALSGEP